jgi:hypothetical protein
VDKTIEVRYAGVVVGRSSVVRELDTKGLFLGVTDPLPVGTDVTLKVGDRVVEGKVASVQESQDAAHSGMRVRFEDPGAASLFGSPAEASSETRPETSSATRPEAHLPAPPAAAPVADVAEHDDAAEMAADASGAHEVTPGLVNGSPDGDGRIPAPDPSALGGHPGGGKKGRRGRRR